MKLKLICLSTLICAGCAHKTAPIDNSDSKSWPLVPQNSAANILPSDQITKDKPAASPLVIPAKLKPTEKVTKIKIPRATASVPDEVEEVGTDTPLVFDVPISYNSKVQYWIQFFQTNGRSWYTKWLERSSRYLPVLKRSLKNEGVPQDLAYLAMIESGFSSSAYSSAKAVGPWQFIRETGSRYGLKINWWLDERRDFQKSTVAAAKYLKKMYGMFNNWYLVAAGYNTGEYRIKRAIERQQTKNFWKIAQHELEDETKDYVPKFIAALLIAKAPEMYGFRNISYSEPLTFEHFRVPGGTRLSELAEAIGVTAKYMEELNPELVRSYVPNNVESHLIRIPKGSLQLVSHYIRKNFVSSR